MISAGKTLGEAENAARIASRDYPGCYVTIYAAFGLFLNIEKRLGRFAPSDSCTDGYWLNGKRRTFSNAQKVRNENETPTLS